MCVRPLVSCSSVKWGSNYICLVGLMEIIHIHQLAQCVEHKKHLIKWYIDFSEDFHLKILKKFLTATITDVTIK